MLTSYVHGEVAKVDSFVLSAHHFCQISSPTIHSFNDQMSQRGFRLPSRISLESSTRYLANLGHQVLLMIFTWVPSVGKHRFEMIDEGCWIWPFKGSTIDLLGLYPCPCSTFNYPTLCCKTGFIWCSWCTHQNSFWRSMKVLYDVSQKLYMISSIRM